MTTLTELRAARPNRLRLGHRTRGFVIRGASWLACRLPERLAIALAEAAGEAWYRVAPARAEQGRRNLRRVCQGVVAEGLGDGRVRAAAVEPAALERLLRSAFRHTARYYLEVARAPAMSHAYVAERLVLDTPEIVEEAFEPPHAVIFIGLHFGAVELPALFMAGRTGMRATVPMETIADPDLQRWFERSRGAAGLRIVGLRDARRELLAALRKGEPVGLVGDRDLTGGGIPVNFFGAPAPLPIGPGLLAIESGAQPYVVAIRRVGPGRYRARVVAVTVPAEGTLRERLTAFLEVSVRAFERAVAAAPDQWWALFQPIWPDLAPGSAER